MVELGTGLEKSLPVFFTAVKKADGDEMILTSNDGLEACGCQSGMQYLNSSPVSIEEV